jgi:hypothetical protein
MNDPKLERCKQVIKQYEENQKKLQEKKKIRPPKISIPKKPTTQKDIVKDIKKMNYTGVQDLKNKVAEEIELDKEINLDEILTDEDTDEEKPKRSSISKNIQKKINKETPKKLSTKEEEKLRKIEERNKKKVEALLKKQEEKFKRQMKGTMKEEGTGRIITGKEKEDALKKLQQKEREIEEYQIKRGEKERDERWKNIKYLEDNFLDYRIKEYANELKKIKAKLKKKPNSGNARFALKEIGRDYRKLKNKSRGYLDLIQGGDPDFWYTSRNQEPPPKEKHLRFITPYSELPKKLGVKKLDDIVY